MVLVGRAVTSRIQQRGEEAKLSAAFLQLPDGELADGVFGPARFFDGGAGLYLYQHGITYDLGNTFVDPTDHLNPNGGYGLLDNEPLPGGYNRPYKGIRAMGTGLVYMSLRLSPGSVTGAPPSATAYVLEDGVVVAQVTVSDPNGGLHAFFPDLFVDVPAFQVKAGRVYTAGITFHVVPLIWAYSSGTGQGLGFAMTGPLSLGEVAQPMRASAVHHTPIGNGV